MGEAPYSAAKTFESIVDASLQLIPYTFLNAVGKS